MLPLLQKRADTALAALLCVAALCVYLKTLCPSFYWGDSAELATAAYTLGIPHPTGYPVWTLLAKAWSLLFPFGSFVWRINILSAVFGTLAVGGVFGAARALGASRAAAILGAGLLAFSGTFWQQCLFAETYSLTACYCAVLLWLAFRWKARGCAFADLKPLAVAYGCAMTNGQMNTLFLPGFLLFVLVSDPSLRRLREPHVRRAWLTLFGLLCLPLLSYLYLPLRAAAQPAVNWGDPRTPFAFWYHVTGRAYAPLMFHGPAAAHWHLLWAWARNLNGEFAWPLVAVAAYGLWAVARRAPASAFLLAWVMAADLVFAVNYEIYNRYIYFLPCYVALSLLMAAGASELVQRMTALVSGTRRPAFAAIAAVCLTLPVPFQAVAHWQANDLHASWACYDYGRNLLASAPPHAILADTGEDTSQFAMMYLQTVEGLRPDVTLVQCEVTAALYDNHYHRWANRWYWDQLVHRDPFFARLYKPGEMTPRDTVADGVFRHLVPAALAAGRPIVVAGLSHMPMINDGTGHSVRMQDYLAQRFDMASVGLVARVYPRGALPPRPALLAETERVWGRYRLRGLSGTLYEQDDFLSPLLVQYAGAALVRARLAYGQGDYETAAQSYQFVLGLFASGEAAVGLDKCAEARARHKRVALAP